MTESAKPIDANGDRKPWMCTAHLANGSGKLCRKPKMEGYNVCDVHGAKGGRPPVTGRFSRRLHESLASKVEELLANGDPFDAPLHALATQVVAFETYVSQFEAGIPLDGKSIAALMDWGTTIANTHKAIVDAKAKAALTAAELKLMEGHYVEVIRRHVTDPEALEAIAREIGELPKCLAGRRGE